VSVKNAAPYFVLLLLVVVCFSLATVVQPRSVKWSRAADQDGVFQVMLGDGRRMFANHFLVKADISFHSGFYPSIFDQAQKPKDSSHMTSEEGSKEEEEHEKEMKFLGKPHDWIESFGRHFMLTEHTHLEGGKEREMLPWLRISAALDPHRVETYTVAAYWLRRVLGKPTEAEQFLRDGLQANPKSYEILFELGRLYRENFDDPKRARGVWELALRRWREQETDKKDPNTLALDKITVNLAKLEQEQGNTALAIKYLEEAKKVSPDPEALQARIDELKRSEKTSPAIGSNSKKDG
jgi:tetratricopeptide (TPR) repeat protein